MPGAFQGGILPGQGAFPINLQIRYFFCNKCNFQRKTLKSPEKLLTSLFASTGLGVLPGVATGTGLKQKSGKIFITVKKIAQVDPGNQNRQTI